MNMPHRAIIAFSILVCAAAAMIGPAEATAFSLEGIKVHAGQVWIGNAYRTAEDGSPVHASDVSPLNLTASGGVRFRVNENLLFSPLVSLHYQEYVRPAGDKAYPTQIETSPESGDVAGILSVVVATPWLYPWRVSEKWEITLGGSPTLLFRIPVRAIEGSQAAPVAGHFYTGVRFFAPEAYTAASYAFTERVDIGVALRTLIPVHNLWDAYSVPFWDEMQIFATATLRISFGE
ncbi:MAG: hypothetical protein GVY29_04875 [Spirochaetes bacterium]|jgi:hypothetical protein|nr:hypothetical protein [Spirochaetota bacterium]